jgi:hypothetical protein
MATTHLQIWWRRHRRPSSEPPSLPARLTTQQPLRSGNVGDGTNTTPNAPCSDSTSPSSSPAICASTTLTRTSPRSTAPDLVSPHRLYVGFPAQGRKLPYSSASPHFQASLQAPLTYQNSTAPGHDCWYYNSHS